MFYQTPGYGYSCGCGAPMMNMCPTNNRLQGNGYALILVLFILLVIIGAARW